MRTRLRPIRTAPARRAEAGFTFIELVLVITIIGLMSTLVVANLDGLSAHSRLHATARQLGNDVMRVQNTAQLQSRELRIEFELKEGQARWRVVDPPSPNEVPDPQEREDETYYGSWYDVDGGVVFEEIAMSRSDKVDFGEFTLSFSANGELSPSGFVAYFRHQDKEADDGVSVEVSGLTGLVHYHQGRLNPEQVLDEDDF